MYYRITIEKVEENPQYEQQLDKWNEENRYGKNFMHGDITKMHPEKYELTNALQTTLSEEQFVDLQNHIIKHWE